MFFFDLIRSILVVSLCLGPNLGLTKNNLSTKTLGSFVHAVTHNSVEEFSRTKNIGEALSRLGHSLKEEDRKFLYRELSPYLSHQLPAPKHIGGSRYEIRVGNDLATLTFLDIFKGDVDINGHLINVRQSTASESFAAISRALKSTSANRLGLDFFNVVTGLQSANAGVFLVLLVGALFMYASYETGQQLEQRNDRICAIRRAFSTEGCPVPDLAGSNANAQSILAQDVAKMTRWAAESGGPGLPCPVPAGMLACAQGIESQIKAGVLAPNAKMKGRR